MAKISYKLVPPEFDLLYKKALTPNDRFTFSSVRRTRSFESRAKIKAITQKSVLPEASAVWATFTEPEKQAWAIAGANSNLKGWSLFVKDFAWAKKLEMSAPLEPDPLYQVEVGRLSISSPATSLKIAQLHPSSYHVLRKVTGTKSQYEPVKIVEDFSLPLEIGISWKTELVSAGSAPLARFYALINSDYQGRSLEYQLSIPFGLSDDWKRASASVSDVKGVVKGYTLFIECQDVTGDIFFDNVDAIHSGQNWARDPFCYNIASSYTKAFFQIPRHWVTIDVPNGAFFDSFYYNQLFI